MSALLNGVSALWNQIVYAVSNMRVFDAIDIIIIALIIYKAIEFLRESRAGQLVKGIVLLIILYILAKSCELAVLGWVLSSIVDSAIIAIAIIFQPEIRRILERMGQTSITSSRLFDSKEQYISDSIDSITKAAGQMQDAKIGALIVFERKTQLGEIINTGTVIDAEASVSMVNNIFFPKSPLHDGALIVRNGRLYAAGCILPLTSNQNISSRLGTRHRAAIGMSENSDAVVLVVSEETGNISVVCDGQIKRGFNSVSAGVELRKYLFDDISAKDENKFLSFIKRINPFSSSKKVKEAESKNEK